MVWPIKTEAGEYIAPTVYLQADPAVEQQLYQEWLLAHKQICSCVLYAKTLTGYEKSIGLAKNWPINNQTPQIGAVVILNESYLGHVAVVEAVFENTIVITEANYIPCKVGSRELNKNDKNIRGYYVP